MNNIDFIQTKEIKTANTIKIEPKANPPTQTKKKKYIIQFSSTKKTTIKIHPP